MKCRIEARHELIDLVMRAANGNASRKIAFHDGKAGAGDGVDARRKEDPISTPAMASGTVSPVGSIN